MTREETARIARIIGMGRDDAPWIWDTSTKYCGCPECEALFENPPFSGPQIGEPGDHIYVGAMREWIMSRRPIHGWTLESLRPPDGWEVFLQHNIRDDVFSTGTTEAEAIYRTALAAGIWKIWKEEA